MKKKLFIFILFVSLYNSILADEINLVNRISSLYMDKKKFTKESMKVDPYSEIIAYGKMYSNVFLPIQFIPFSVSYDFYKDRIIANLWLSKRSSINRNNGYNGIDITIPVNLPPQISGVIGEGVNLKIKGSDKIEIGGTKDMDLREDIPDELKEESMLPQLEIKQHFQVDLTGTVGQKVHVNIKHDSEAQTSWDNNVKIWYSGDEDEIVQSIEAGNVAISLPGTRLISSSAGHQGLFGIKGTFKLGPLDMVAVMSRDEGETKDASFSISSDSLILNDMDYIRNQFFIIGEPGSDSILKIFVYVDDNNSANNVDQNAQFAECYYYPDTDSVAYTGYFEYKDLSQEDFYYIDRYSNILVLNNPLPSTYSLGISYIVQRSSGEIDTVGYVFGGEDEPLKLKLLKPATLLPSSPAWNYQLKNIYKIPMGILPHTFTIRIFRKKSDGSLEETYNGVPYVKLLGLVDDEGEVKPEVIDFVRGYLIFPWEIGDGKPFNSSSLPEQVPEIYDSLNYYLYGGKYIMDIRYYKDNSEISLGVTNIIEGSEEIKVNNIILKRGVDYSIDYDLGIVRIFDLQKYGENPDITVNYQYMPVFSMANKSFMGLRAEYSPSQNLKSDAAIIYNSQFYPQNDYPSLGEEDNNIVLGESGLNYKYTKEAGILEVLPGVKNSNVSFSSDLRGAFSKPDPSTRGVGYIDDMESILTTIDLNMSYDSWHFGSVPYSKDTSLFAKNYYWYNVQIPAGYINPSLPLEEAKQEKNVLNIFWSVDSLQGTDGYMSLMQCISKTGYDLSNHKYIEVWVRTRKGKLHIDLGTNIPEDAPRRNLSGEIVGYDNELNTEDFKIKDGQLNEGEDVGLDGVAGADNLFVAGDDRNDDYYYQTGSTDYSHINGTEGNNKLDTEDLDGNGTLNLINDFVEFDIDLSSREYEVMSVDSTGWRLLRIPIDSLHYTKMGSPDMHVIKYVRLWTDNTDDSLTIPIGGISIVGNKWMNEMVVDSMGNEDVGEVMVTVKNNQLDSDYIPPYDPGYDMYLEPKKEQSLVVKFSDVNPKDKVRLMRIDTESKDYTRYNNLRFYVRGKDINTDSKITIKFGSDTLNYYYVKTQIINDQWKDVGVNISTLINLKKEYMDEGEYNSDSCGFKGNPSFTSVRYMIIEIENLSETDIMNGEVWIDDIRLTSPDRKAGYAGIASLSLGFGDLGSTSFSINYTDPYFTRSKDRTGTYRNSYSFSASSRLGLNAFVPADWHISLPLNFSYSRSNSYPIKYPNSDIFLDSVDIDTMDLNEYSKRWNISTSFSKRNSSFWLYRILLDRSSFSWNMGYSFNKRWNSIDSSKNISYRFSYDLTPKLKPLKLFNKWDFKYYPDKLKAGGSGGWSESYSYIKTDSGYIPSRDPLYSHKLGGNASIGLSPFKFISFNANVSVDKDKMQPHDTLNWYNALGRDIRRKHDYSIGFNPSLGRYINFRTNFRGGYSENHDYNLVGSDSTDVRNVSNNRSVSASLNLNVFSSLSKIYIKMKRDTTIQTGDPKWLFMNICNLLSKFSSPSISTSFSNRSDISYINDIPDIMYQFAIIDTMPDSLFTDRTTVRRSKQFNVSLSEGLSLGMISLSTSYNYSRSLSDNMGNQRLTETYTFPSINGSINGLQKYGLFKKFLSSLSVNSSYNKRYSFTSNPLDTLAGASISVSENFSPLIGSSYSLRKGINGDYRYTITNSQNLSPMPDGSYSGRKSYSHMHSFNLRYSFRSPSGIKIPFTNKRIRIKNNLDTSIRFDYKHNLDISISGYKDTTGVMVVEDGDTTNNYTEWSVAPSGSYNFSSSFTGGFNFLITQRENPILQEKRRKITVKIWGQIRF